MRTVTGAIVVALGMAAAQPAFAGTGAAPAGTAPLLNLDAAVAPAALVELAPVAIEAPTFRLAPLTLEASLPASQPTADIGGAGLRHRLTGNMMEFYPFAGSGFHLSGGSRLFARRNFTAETENSARGALAVTRTTISSGVTRAGFKRFNPVMTAGYTVAVSHLAQIGVEAGAMMSRAFAGTPGLPRHGFGYRSDTSFHPDAIANLVFGMRF